MDFVCIWTMGLWRTQRIISNDPSCWTSLAILYLGDVSLEFVSTPISRLDEEHKRKFQCARDSCTAPINIPPD